MSFLPLADESKASKKLSSAPFTPHPLKDAGTSDLEDDAVFDSPANVVATPSPKALKPTVKKTPPSPWPLQKGYNSTSPEAAPTALEAAKTDALVHITIAIEDSKTPEEVHKPVEVSFATQEEQLANHEAEKVALSIESGQDISLQEDFEAVVATEERAVLPDGQVKSEENTVVVVDSISEGGHLKEPDNGIADSVSAWLESHDVDLDAHAVSAELQGAQLRKDAAELEFHAQVLENRRRALLRESQAMVELGIKKGVQANNLAGKHFVFISK